ncbi:hypothetical protein [Pseudomonas sichuanensis]|uniref:hypothetical protein n=1 Tax=Pseudomonas sichuanensis TaxID=2213015 RepID=UPI002ACB14AE|nr:hypothetical protein [Pseudomonas sichuanensis]
MNTSETNQASSEFTKFIYDLLQSTNTPRSSLQGKFATISSAINKKHPLNGSENYISRANRIYLQIMNKEMEKPPFSSSILECNVFEAFLAFGTFEVFLERLSTRSSSTIAGNSMRPLRDLVAGNPRL